MMGALSVNGTAFDPAAAPGTIRIVDKVPVRTVLVTCGGATELRVLSVKLPGGRASEDWSFAAGPPLTEGERFGEA